MNISPLPWKADFDVSTAKSGKHHSISRAGRGSAGLWLVLWIASIIASNTTAHANVPGGVVGISSTYPAVTLVTNTAASPPTATLSNGLVTAVIDITTSQILTVTYSGYQVTDGGTGGANAFYWQGQNSVGEQTGAFGVLNVIANPATNSGTMGEIMIADLFTNHTSATDSADDAYRYFTMFQGSPGIYVTEVMARPNTYPAGGADLPSMTGKLTSTPFNWIAQDSGPQNTIAPSDTATTIAGVNSCPKEVTLMGDGVLQGRFDCKYNYSGDLGLLSVTGWCANKETSTPNIGLWVIRPSSEYNSSGPKHPEIQTQLMNLNITFKGVHFGFGSDLGFAAGETWSHVNGPFFIYLDKQAPTAVVSGSNPELTGTAQVALFADAQAQAAAEKGAWPYAWFSDSHWVPASGRGTVTGQLVISDSGNPLASASNMWVGVAQQPSSTASPAPTDFQEWAKGYQFWTHTDANGNFTIPNVIAGTNYTLFSFGPGAIGQFQSQPLTGGSNPFTIIYPSTPFSVAVTAGTTTNLGSVTWPVTRAGPTAWEIGVPDRDTTEFRHGQDYWHGDLGTAAHPAVAWSPYLNYAFDFPNGLAYNPATSVWSRDWNYADPCVQTGTSGVWNTTTQTVNFTLPQAPLASSTASLYFSIAADDNGVLVISINGTNISNPSTGIFLSYGTNDAMIRMESHGIWSDLRVNFAANLLKFGSNQIQLTQRKGGYFADSVAYDYLRLEVPGYIPPAPASLSVYAGNAQNVLNWPAAPGATSYTILRSATSATTGYLILASNVPGPIAGSTVLPASYTDTSAGNGTTYFYEVESANVVGASTNSTAASGAPTIGAPGVPAAPAGLALTNGNEQASLTWTAATGASYYVVERSQASGGPYTIADTTTTTSCTDTGLSNSEGYYYTVAAVNATGTSALSSEVTAAPMPAVITIVPPSITGTISGGFPYITWGAVGGASHYIVESSTNSAGPFTQLYAYDVSQFYQDTSAAPASKYYYEVAAANLSSQTAFSSPIGVSTQSAAPASLTAYPGNTQVSLTWQQIFGVTGYTIQRSTTSGASFATVGSSVGGAYTDTGLTNGKTYYYEVAGVNNSGTGVYSAQVSAAPSAGAPLAPAVLSATGGDFQVALNWTPSSGATAYTVYEGVQTGGPYSIVAAGISGTTYTDTLLAPDSTYFYVVQASSITGTSAFSSEANATTFSHASTLLVWDANGDNPSDPVDGPGGWDNISTVWSTGTTDIAWDNTASFGAQIGNQNGGAGTVTISGTVSAAELLFSPATSGTYTLTSGTLIMSGSNPVIGVNAPSTVATTLTGTGTLQVFGNSPLTLTNPMTYTGPEKIEDMEVILDGPNFSAAMLGSGSIELDNSIIENISFNIGGGSVSASEFANSLFIPAGQTGTVICSQRTTWGSAAAEPPITGAGILNIQIASTITRDYLYDNFSAFTGQINIIGTTAGSAFQFDFDNNSNGSANAQWAFGGAGSTTFALTPESTNTISFGSLSGGTNATLNGGTGTVTYSIGALGLNTNFSGGIVNNAAVTKVGGGTQILSGTYNYTGATTVQAGVLEFTGTNTSTSSVSISSGATMYLAGGSFSVTGNVTNHGIFKISGSPVFTIGGTFTNQGVLDLINGPQTLPANFVNSGTVLFPGNVKIQGVTVSGTDGTSISLQGYAQHTYQLQKTGSVTAPVIWSNVGATQTGTGGALTFTDPAASGTSGFYRVFVSP